MSWWSVLVDGPARLLGGFAGPIIGIAVFVGSIFVAAFLVKHFDRLVLSRFIQLESTRQLVGIAVGFVFWLYIAAVLWETQKYTAFSLLQALSD